MQKKVDLSERDFFKNPLSLMEMETLLQGKPATEMFNFRSPSFKKLNLDREKLTNSELLELMLHEPRLIRRPVAKIGKKVYFGATGSVLMDLLG